MKAETAEAVEFLDDQALLDSDERDWLARGANTLTYGPFFEQMVLHGVGNVRKGHSDPESVAHALGIAAMLYTYADTDYRKQPSALVGDALEAHQANVLSGKPVLVAEEAGVSEAASIEQVKNANDFLSWQPSRVEATLAAINYGAFFKPETMASATRTLDRRDIDELLETARVSTEAMPHLSVSNWAVGQIVAGAYRHVASLEGGQRIRVIDLCSGHGATLAAITSSINALEDVDRKPEFALTAIETTPEFYDELADFASTDAGVQSLGLDVTKQGKGPNISEFGSLTVVKGDAVETIKGARLSGKPNDELTIVTANYGFHRLGGAKKAEIIDRFARFSNIIFVVGDLAQNTSVINRRYFNLAANGPLNAGNRNLGNQFGWRYYSNVNLEKHRPSALDPRLANRINHDDKHNDGHLWIAHWGPMAGDALDLVGAA